MSDGYLDEVLEKGPTFSYKELLDGDEQTLIEIETVLELASEVDGYGTYRFDDESMSVMVTSEVLEETLETLYQAYFQADEEKEDEIQDILSRYGLEDYMGPDEFDIEWEPETSLRGIDKLGKAGVHDELVNIVSKYDEYSDTDVTEKEVERALSYLKEEEDILLKIAQSEDARTVRERSAILLAREGYEEEVIELIDSSTNRKFLEDISTEMIKDEQTEVLKDAFIRSVNKYPYGHEDTEIAEAFFIEEEFDELEALAENADERMMTGILVAGREAEKNERAKNLARENGHDELLESFSM